jgi:hypothetical protein
MSGQRIRGRLKQLFPSVTKSHWQRSVADFWPAKTSPVSIVIEPKAHRARTRLDVAEYALHITSEALCCDIAIKRHSARRTIEGQITDGYWGRRRLGTLWKDCLPNAADTDNLDILAEYGVFCDVDERTNAVGCNNMDSFCKVDDGE